MDDPFELVWTIVTAGSPWCSSLPTQRAQSLQCADRVVNSGGVLTSTLHLMVGLPCSGKTTLARQLERKYSALRLTTDEWHTRLFGQDATDEQHDARHEAIEALLWDIASRALSLGVDVILDFGCWVRWQRDDFRARAKTLGADFKIHFTDASEEVLLQRLVERNSQLPHGVFQIPEASLKEWFSMFEPPAEEELA